MDWLGDFSRVICIIFLAHWNGGKEVRSHKCLLWTTQSKLKSIVNWTTRKLNTDKIFRLEGFVKHQNCYDFWKLETPNVHKRVNNIVQISQLIKFHQEWKYSQHLVKLERPKLASSIFICPMLSELQNKAYYYYYALFVGKTWSFYFGAVKWRKSLTALNILCEINCHLLLVKKYQVQELSSKKGCGRLPKHERWCGKLQYIFPRSPNSMPTGWGERYGFSSQ